MKLKLRSKNIFENFDFKKLNIISITLIGSIFLCINGCKPKSDTDIFTVASAGKIKSLDPSQASTFDTLQLLSGLGDTLYRLSSEGVLMPSLASDKPMISENGLKISIPLKKNILFHDGERFDSYAMAFSLNRFMQIGTLNYIIGSRIKSLETPNPYLLVINLTKPSSSIEGLLTSINLTPVSPKSYKEYSNKFLNNNFIGTGPYKVVSFKDNQIKLVPFDKYRKLNNINKGINFISFSNSTALYGAMKKGDIDVLLSNSIDEDQRKSLNSLSLKGYIKEGTGPALEIGYLTLSTKSPPLDNSLIRKALSYSLDRDLISKRVSYGLRRPLRSLIPPSLKSSATNPWPKYDLTKARGYLKKSGYCDSKKLILNLTYRSNVPADKLFALTWQSQIKRDLPDCIVLKIEGLESTAIYKQLSKGSFELVMLDWRGAYPDAEAYLSPLLSCDKSVGSNCLSGESVMSGSFWASEYVEKALKESDRLRGSQRMQTLESIEAKASTHVPYLPVWLVSPTAWVQSDISTPEFDGGGQLLLQNLHRIKK